MAITPCGSEVFFTNSQGMELANHGTPLFPAAFYHDDLERFDPWDASTWEISDCNYQAVYPLENDVAITALYETLREAAEDFRMLDALKAAGKADVLKEVLSRADAAWDRTRYAYRHLDPKAPDILDLRERILSEF